MLWALPSGATMFRLNSLAILGLDGSTSLEIRGLGLRAFSRLWIPPKAAKQNSGFRARVEKSERISVVFWREEERAKERIMKNQVAETYGRIFPATPSRPPAPLRAA
jgi:hypothetical protein